LRGYLAWDETATARRPGVLVFHEGLGLGEFAMARARMLAELGYVAMRAAAVRDWQLISYGNTLHGFTNPAADGSIMRAALYSEQADRRSWASMRSLFDEVFQ
jgi:dienelactone hydrolase